SKVVRTFGASFRLPPVNSDYMGFPTCQGAPFPASARDMWSSVKRSACGKTAKRRVRTARLQTVIDAAL
ncbi:MAG: hypothetical protein LC674_06145, partial [Actinobacteria bacterium]|nr:hypothetical protein [Actinomycetota bacterium]